MKNGRIWRHAFLACGMLAVASVSSVADEARSRTLFQPGPNNARDLVVVLDPAQKPPPGSEVSVYLPIQFGLPMIQPSCR